MFEARYGLFGAVPDDVLACLPHAGYADVATVLREAQGGCSAGELVVDSTAGLGQGDWLHVAFPGHDEVRVVDEVVSSSVVTVTEDFSAVPPAGCVVDNGPEFVRRELVRAEGFVVSKLPDRYRGLLRRVEGEVIVRRASDGQDAAVLGLTPSGGVRLYLNFEGMLSELEPGDELDEARWSVDGRTLSFEPGLREGDRVLASYDVGVCSGGILQSLVVDLAVFRVGRRLVGVSDRVTAEWLMLFRDRGERVVEQIFSSGCGVPELDDLVLWEDWVRSRGGIRSGVVELG